MRNRSIFRTVVFSLIFVGMLTKSAQAIDFSPNKKELNLPFQYSQGKIEFNMDYLKNKKAGHAQLIANCQITYNDGQSDVQVDLSVYKNLNLKTAKVVTTSKGGIRTNYYPYVASQTVSKDSLGQYSTALEVAQMMGITEVDSMKAYIIDPRIDKLKNLIFFYDSDADLIDRTVFINNQWKRCE